MSGGSVGVDAAAPAARSRRVFPSRAVDMTGQRMGRLTILRLVGRTGHGHAIWECRCDCGALHRVSRRSLLHPVSPTRSCGCLHAELSRARAAAQAARARRRRGAADLARDLAGQDPA